MTQDSRKRREEMPSLAARDAKRVWHPYTQHARDAQPLEVVAARGSVLELADGREIVDAISSWWTSLHGHGHPVLLEAMARQAAKLDHVLFAGATHEPAVALAERLVDVAPRGLSRVFYSDDGSTAVEVALKIAHQSFVNAGEPERTVFVALEGGYHGDTFGAMAVGDPDPYFRAFQPMMFEVARAAVDAASVRTKLGEVGRRAAGVIVEPLVQGAAGMRMHEPEFLRGVRDACDEHGVPMIADEVMTGFGRTGRLFACGIAGVRPDLLCLAKGLTGGLLPLAATLATERLFEAFLSSDRAKTFFHGHSFTAHPIGCAVAMASLEMCVKEGVPARLDRIGVEIERGIRAQIAPRVHVRELRRRGGIVALELEPGSEGSERVLRMRRRALEVGVLLRPLGNVVYALPPASTTSEQCARIVDAVCAVAEV